MKWDKWDSIELGAKIFLGSIYGLGFGALIGFIVLVILYTTGVIK